MHDLVAKVAALPRPLLLALDVDGTLAPIVDRPEDARVPLATQAVLRELAAKAGVTLALITGRDSAALAGMISLPSAWRATEHGRVVLPPGEAEVGEALSLEQQEALSSYAAWAAKEAQPAGALIEVKASSVAVHVRQLRARDPQAAELVLSAARAAAQAAGLFPRDGRAVLEAEVQNASKATALATISARVGAAGVVYVGDDVTDEAAIVWAAEQGGLGAFVCSEERPRAPEGCPGFTGVPAVAAWLDQLKAEL